MTELQRQVPIKNKKLLLWLIPAVLFLPIPLLVVNYVEKMTGMSEIQYLENLSEEERAALFDEVQAQEAESLAYFQSIASRSPDENTADPMVAVHMSRLLARQVLGPLKVIVFPGVNEVQVKKVSDNGYELESDMLEWNGKAYGNSGYNMNILHRGDNVWQVARMNVHRKKGILRGGVMMEMPLNEITFNTGLLIDQSEK